MHSLTAQIPVDVRPQFQKFEALMRWAMLLSGSHVHSSNKMIDFGSQEVLNLFKSLNHHNVHFLLVGGMANIVYGHTRTTSDIDLWIKSTPENQNNLVEALKENDVAGAHYLLGNPLIFGWTSVKFGHVGFELDLGFALKHFTENDFDKCYERATQAAIEDVTFRVIRLDDFIEEKKATGRLKDLADVEELIKYNKTKT